MARYQEEDRPSTATSDDVGKLMSKFDSLEYSIRKMSVADPTHRQQKYKPEVTPPHQRGGQSRGRGSRQYNQHHYRSNSDSRQYNQANYRSNLYSSRDTCQYRDNNRDRGNGSPNVRCPRVARRTPGRDKLRCHYCKEFRHFIKNCLKRQKDEERAAKLHVMTPLTLQQETEDDHEDYYAYNDEILGQHTVEHLNNSGS